MSEVKALSNLATQRASKDKVTEVMMAAYKGAFLKTDAGRKVLAHICRMAGFFNFAAGHDDMVRQNFVKQILCNCGVWDDRKSMDIVRKLSELI